MNNPYRAKNKDNWEPSHESAIPGRKIIKSGQGVSLHFFCTLFHTISYSLHTCQSLSRGSQEEGPEIFDKSSSTLLQDFRTQTVLPTDRSVFDSGGNSGELEIFL